MLTTEWESEDGLAWSPDGKEVWFTGVERGINRDLLAVNMSGRIRKMLDLPAGMTLEDVAPDGRVLVSLDDERIAMATTARDGKSVDLSWHDWNIAKDISAMGSRSCSKIPAKRLGLTIPLPFEESTALHRCNWAKAARAAFHRTANGRFLFSRVVLGG